MRLLPVLLLFCCIFWQPFDLVCVCVCYNAAFLRFWLRVVFLGICVKSVSIIGKINSLLLYQEQQHFLRLCFYSDYCIICYIISLSLFSTVSWALLASRWHREMGKVRVDEERLLIRRPGSYLNPG